MTKDKYFELCELLGNDPIESEIPISISDFPELIQEVFQIYFLLSDIWDTLGGNYLGKNLDNIFEFFNLYGLSDAEKLLSISIIQEMDNVRKKIISAKAKANMHTKPSGKKA